eukprot:1826340-Alexandrium_andersonii.AAC.1
MINEKPPPEPGERSRLYQRSKAKGKNKGGKRRKRANRHIKAEMSKIEAEKDGEYTKAEVHEREAKINRLIEERAAGRGSGGA